MRNFRIAKFKTKSLELISDRIIVAENIDKAMDIAKEYFKPRNGEFVGAESTTRKF